MANWWENSAIRVKGKIHLFRLHSALIILGLVACQMPAAQFSTNTEIPAGIHGNDELLQVLKLEEGEPLSDAVIIEESIRYRLKQRMTVTNYGPDQPSKHNLWLALIRSISPYQQVEAIAISPAIYELVTDEYGNVYAEFAFHEIPVENSVQIEVDYEIILNRVDVDLNTCAGDIPDEFTQPELHIESNNPQIRRLAQQIPLPRGDICQQVRAYYDYVGDNLLYTFNGGDWGAQAALGDFGADCTEYASLMIALCRAAGVPARYLEGLQLTGSDRGEARLEHSWVEVYLPGIGWAPFDPTLGRIPGSRERYFAALPADHVIITVGRHPSILRGSSYYSHLYWGAADSEIKVENYDWQIIPINK